MSLRLRWIEQEPKKRNCGQIAVAVVTGYTLETVIEIIGHDHGTATRQLVRALRILGFTCPDYCRSRERPERGLAQVHTPGRSGWHWVVVDGPRIFDGVSGDEQGRVLWPDDWRMTSYLPVTHPAHWRVA